VRPDPLAPPEGYGVKPEAAVPDSSHCSFPGCIHPVSWAITMGDMQEHVFPMYQCDCHKQLTMTSNNDCTVCQHAPRDWRKADPRLVILRTEQTPDAAPCPTGLDSALRRAGLA